MNAFQRKISSLPKPLQDIIGEFNVEHRPCYRAVLHEVVVAYQTRMERAQYCNGCEGVATEEYSAYFLWRKYHFCSEWCKNEEYHYYLIHAKKGKKKTKKTKKQNK